MKKQYAFIDAYGDPAINTEKSGASSHFIVTAVIVTEDNLVECERKAEEIRKRHFQTGEIKSEKVGSKHGRRLKILNELMGLNVIFYSLIVDKRLIEQNGLKYRTTFYKFISGKLFSELYRTYPNLKVISDEVGNIAFMKSFEKYVLEHHVTDLFNQADFEFVKSHSSLLVQVADFIAGTLARSYDIKKRTALAREFLIMIKNKSAGLIRWPDYNNFLYSEYDKYDENDKTIAKLSFNLAINYVKSKENSLAQEDRDRVLCLRYLMLCCDIEPQKYIYSDEIIQHLNINKKKLIDEQYFRSEIIAKLREEGLLIASSQEGYKLPTCVADCYSYINKCASIIIPMLKRMKKFTERIKLATNNKLDLIDKKEFMMLKHALEGEMDRGTIATLFAPVSSGKVKTLNN